MTRLLGWLSLLALGLGLFLGLAYAPREVTQGSVQRIMYLHVPAVLTAYLAFGVVFVASFGFLVSRRLGWDRLALASAELGVLFTGLTLVSGSIWGKPTWGAWWTWDARLTTTAVLFVIYVGYLLLRGFTEERERGARYAAVLGPERAPISSPLLVVLLVNVAAFVLLYGYFLVKRLTLLQLEEEIEA